MAEFVYNNVKNTRTGHTSLKLYYSYYLYVFFENKTNPYSKFCSVNKLVKELKDLMAICQQHLFYTQELQKRVYDKGVKPKSYVSGEKV